MPLTVNDPFARPLRDLRISVTDRCNFRCPYCMPKEVFGAGYAFLRDPQLMTPVEITRIVRAFRALGVEKVRLTGGEPLLRADVPDLVRALKTELGVPDVALTTNGWLLEKLAPALSAAGLNRVNVSVDSLDDATAGRMNGLGFSVARVLRGIDAAAALALPVKINCVVQRGVNDHELVALCEYFRARGHALRFIEFMDVGNTNHWSSSQVVPAREIVGVIGDDGTSAPQHAALPSLFMSLDASLPGSPYLIVKDFLDQAAFDQVLAFALAQEQVYAAATVTDTVADYRRAKVLFDVSTVQSLFVPRVRAMIPAAFSQLGLQPVTLKTIECQLTAHGEGDYFKRHNDNGSPETAGRTLTYVYYFNREPKRFTGGHLRLYETVVENGFYTGGPTSRDIEPLCNSMILFPSYCHHEVTPVKCPSGEFGDRRFTVNGWVVRPT